MRFDRRDYAIHLLLMKRAKWVGSRAIQLLPLSQNTARQFTTAIGYDHAVGRTPADDMRQVWEIRESWGIAVWQYTGNGRQRLGVAQ